MSVSPDLRTVATSTPVRFARSQSRQIRAPGLFAVYVAGYSGFRIFEELLRTDPAHHILGLRLNFFVATTLCLIGLARFARTQRAGGTRQQLSRGGPAALGLGWLIVALSGCGHGSHARAAGTQPAGVAGAHKQHTASPRTPATGPTSRVANRPIVIAYVYTFVLRCWA